jgi:signal transduction histidine kinase
MARTPDRARRLITALWIAAVVLGVAGLILTAVAWDKLTGSDFLNPVTAFAGIVYASLGTLIVRRVGNVIGWILLGAGLAFVILAAASAYAVIGIAVAPALPGPEVVGAIAEWSFVDGLLLLAFMLFVFPTGTLPSPRWRPVAGLAIAAGVLTSIGWIVNPGVFGVPAPGGSWTFRNPAGISSLHDVVGPLLVGAVWVVALTTGAGFASLVVRYRAGGPELRLQIKWVAFTTALALLCLVGALVALMACGCDSSVAGTVLLNVNALLVLFGVPIAIAIAILKHRLYDIDLIINRAVVYGLLAAALTAVYVAVVAGVGTLVGSRGSSLLTVAAAVAIALLFQPLRRRAQGLANRLVYGDRATPYQVLSEFAERMAGTYGVEDVLERMASILAAGTGATRVDVWLRVGRELRPVARWPPEAEGPAPAPLGEGEALPAFGDLASVAAVRHGDELLGALALQKPPNEPLSVTESRLLDDLAAQAGLVLRNVRLTADLQANVEELRASRRRLVQAQDEERRKIERNLHDGAQQQLVALTVQLGLLDRLADDPERVRQMSAQLQTALRDALDDLRDLARGIYPPLLADKGLVVALEAQGRKAAVATTVEPDGVGRYPQEVEAAVYFCALEAMQNVAKYAEATSAVVRLSERENELVFEIRDDGRGFDPSRTSYGTGLRGMADRLEAIGGLLDVRSEPGVGTTVRGSISVYRRANGEGTRPTPSR